MGGETSNGQHCFEAAQLLAKRGADVAKHSALLTDAFGKELATELIKSAADLPPTADALTENLRQLLDEAQANKDEEGN